MGQDLSEYLSQCLQVVWPSQTESQKSPGREQSRPFHFLTFGFGSNNLILSIVATVVLNHGGARMDSVDGFSRFMSQFRFDRSMASWVGVEREAFLIDETGNIVPRAQEVLACLGESFGNRFGFELSACQFEDRVGPCPSQHLEQQLWLNERILGLVERWLKLRRSFIEVAPIDMPLDVYPYERYQRIVATMPREMLLAACRVAGVHVHIGMPDHSTALKVYNHVIGHCDELCQLGDGSNGERLRLYKQVAPNCQPRSYDNWQDFYGYMAEQGLDQEPRGLWTLVRISIHGTIEFRTFGTTDNQHKIIYWADRCQRLCLQAM